MRLDISGQRFGKLVAIEIVGQSRLGSIWRCQCDCGESTTATTAQLRHGRPRSCGCAQGLTKHGASRTSEYNIWAQLRARCLNPDHRDYPDYGGRGITVCERWQEGFENFIADMGPRPSPQHSIDRIDNAGPYAPENCRWATFAQQNRNNRRTVELAFQGRTMPISDWADFLGVSRRTLNTRRRLGWTTEQILGTPFRGRSTDSRPAPSCAPSTDANSEGS